MPTCCAMSRARDRASRATQRSTCAWLVRKPQVPVGRASPWSSRLIARIRFVERPSLREILHAIKISYTVGIANPGLTEPEPGHGPTQAAQDIRLAPRVRETEVPVGTTTSRFPRTKEADDVRSHPAGAHRVRPGR